MTIKVLSYVNLSFCFKGVLTLTCSTESDLKSFIFNGHDFCWHEEQRFIISLCNVETTNESDSGAHMTWSISFKILQLNARQRSSFHCSVWSVSSHMQRDNGAWKTVWEIVSILSEFHPCIDNCSPCSWYDALCSATFYIQKFFL